MEVDPVKKLGFRFHWSTRIYLKKLKKKIKLLIFYIKKLRKNLCKSMLYITFFSWKHKVYILMSFNSHIEKIQFFSCKHRVYILMGFKYHIKKKNIFLGT